MAKDKNTYGLKVGFTDWESYQRWLVEWRKSYKSIASECKTLKGRIREAQDSKNSTKELRYREEYLTAGSIAGKLMRILEIAKEQWLNIKKLSKEYKNQKRNWPITLTNIENASLRFNENSSEFKWLPNNILVVGNKNYYINGFECNTRCKSGDEIQAKLLKVIALVESVDIVINESGVAIINNVECN